MSDDTQQANDDAVRELVVVLISFIATARAPQESKECALDAIDKLRARLLP